jgi:hypothetical protein
MDQQAPWIPTTMINRVSIVETNKIQTMGTTMPVSGPVTLPNKIGILELDTMVGEGNSGINTAIAAVVIEEEEVEGEDFSADEVVVVDAGDVEVDSVTTVIKVEAQLVSKMQEEEEEITIESEHEMTIVTTEMVAGGGSIQNPRTFSI